MSNRCAIILSAFTPPYALAVCALLAWPGTASAGTRTFVVGYFGQATYSQDSDCPAGLNPDITVQYLRNLKDLGLSQERVDEIARNVAEGEGNAELNELMQYRGRIDGQPVSAYTYPAAVKDPNLHASVGREAYGFNLDDRIDPNDFVDPETQEKGVDDALARAFGCMRPFRGSLAGRPTYWAWAWGQLKDSQPAWLITIEGADLTKDGDVTVTFDRALHYVKSNIDGSPRADVTYQIDPDQRSHNVMKGRLTDGTVVIADYPTFRMLQNPMVVNNFQLINTHMRLNLKPDGNLDGLIGGYQPWADIYSGFASGAPGMEMCITGDIPGLYYLLKKHADALPDPKTGENAAISAAYYLEAVPAFIVSPDGKLIAGP